MKRKDRFMVCLILYVDSMFIITKENYIVELKILIPTTFGVNDLRAARRISGIKIHRDCLGMKLFSSQKSYIKKVLIYRAKLVATPLAMHLSFSDDSKDVHNPICKCCWELNVCCGLHEI